jgi:hypothetical protein
MFALFESTNRNTARPVVQEWFLRPTQPARNAISIPIIRLDARLRQFCETVRTCFSQPQFKYPVTVLLALMLCQETHTLSGLLRQVADGQSISGVSRFLNRSSWSAADIRSITRGNARTDMPCSHPSAALFIINLPFANRNHRRRTSRRIFQVFCRRSSPDSLMRAISAEIACCSSCERCART